MSDQFIIKNNNYKKEDEEIENNKNNDELVYYKRISFYENFLNNEYNDNFNNANNSTIFVPLNFYYNNTNNIINYNDYIYKPNYNTNNVIYTPTIKSFTDYQNNISKIHLNNDLIYDNEDPFFFIWNELTSNNNKIVESENKDKNYNLTIYSKIYNLDKITSGMANYHFSS